MMQKTRVTSKPLKTGHLSKMITSPHDLNIFVSVIFRNIINIRQKIRNMQGWEKSIAIDIRLRYSLLFVCRINCSLYFFE